MKIISMLFTFLLLLTNNVVWAETNQEVQALKRIIAIQQAQLKEIMNGSQTFAGEKTFQNFIDIQNGGLRIGDGGPKSRVGFYMDFTLDNSSNCTDICKDLITPSVNHATKFGFDSGSGSCIHAWLESTGTPLECGSRVPTTKKRCLCVGMIK